MTAARPVRLLHHDAAERPFIVIWEVTRACQLVCTHCRADAIRSRNPFELSTDEGRRLLDDLASFGAPRPLVVLTGGDPFERPDLAELVAHGTKIGLSMSLSPSVTDRLTRPLLVDLRRRRGQGRLAVLGRRKRAEPRLLSRRRGSLCRHVGRRPHRS